MKKYFWFLLLVSVIALMLVGGLGCQTPTDEGTDESADEEVVDDQTWVLKLGNIDAVGNPAHLANEKLVELVAEKTDGRVTIELYPASQLGGAIDQIESIAMGTQEMPPNQVVIGLSLFLTLFIMFPVFSNIYSDAVGPYMDKKIEMKEALTKSKGHLSEFLLKQTREEDLALFVRMAQVERPNTPQDVPLFVLVPSFIISELKTAFQMGFILFLPFIIIDMVIASILLSMGMFMLPPIIISTPFKILLFILVDGWHLIGRSLALSFQ